MALEDTNCTRDYLWGRLLAVAHHTEQRLFRLTNARRMTMAQRRLRAFTIAPGPCKTWPRIHEAMVSAEAQLYARGEGEFVEQMQELESHITSKFATDDFLSDAPLGGEYMLGHDLQLHALTQAGKAGA